MTTSSEDVLLQIPQVRYKKGDGTLYVMDQRIAWMLENRDNFSISHPYQDIKAQKISPEGKPKIQLQVVLHSGVSSTFHFVNRDGAQAQAADRDCVKELLQTLLPKFKRKVDKELEEKNKLLSSHPSLLQLYKDLVMTEVVTSEEFWAQHAGQHVRAQQAPPQQIGISGAFLADIKPQTDGCNGLKYNITGDIIECIFKTYPAVRRKYAEHVPAKLSEAEFWTRFFQSHYFHRDRIHAGTKDLFTECGRLDDQELRRDMAAGTRDLLTDVAAFQDTAGLDEDAAGSGGCSPQAAGSAGGAGNVPQSMIKRFNQHSIMVLKAGVAPERQDAQDSQDVQDAPVARDGRERRRRVREKVTYEDLAGSEVGATGTARAPLALSRIERYLHGPVAGAGGAPDAGGGDVPALLRRLRAEAQLWGARQPAAALVSPAAAVSVLGELSPGGALMRSFQEQSLAQLVPADVERDLRHLYLALCELLRHFWLAFPPTTAALEQRAVRMHEALRRFHAAKLKPLEDRLLRELSPLARHLTAHLNQLLTAAYAKFSTWQQRKVQLSHR